MSLKELEKKALSDQEIKRALDNKVSLVKYNEIKNYNSIDDLLGKHRKCVILFEMDNNIGHWCCVLEIKPKNKKPYILFHDSYGLYPTNQINYLPYVFKKIQKPEYLLKLLKE